ncbi:MAG: hypothetical protein DLM71_08770 [Chloroflexi bacterium]|nr:MAG: hypothetical protein DLM71_08770 [Chloroflexota bacterium]
MVEQRAGDPYTVLGVARDATPLQVARAHRRLAKQFHPDLHPGEDAAGRMRRINEAWRLLSSPVRRAAYDVAHPTTGPAANHWAPTRRTIRPAAPTTTRIWAEWRATADETRAAPRTMRQPGEVQLPPTRRPQPMGPEERRFRDSGWAAVIVAGLILILLLAAIAIAKLG